MVNYRPLQKASSAENLHALVYVSKILVFRFTGRDPERHFRYQHPIFRQLPCTADFLVYQRIIMLKGSSQSPFFQHRPNGKLVHCRSMLGPRRKIILVRRKSILQPSYHRHVFKYNTVPWPLAKQPSILASVLTKASAGIRAFKVSFTISQSFCARRPTTTRFSSIVS